MQPSNALLDKFPDVPLELSPLHGPGQVLGLPLGVGLAFLVNHLALDLTAAAGGGKRGESNRGKKGIGEPIRGDMCW